MTFQALSWYIPVYTGIYWYILFIYQNYGISEYMLAYTCIYCSRQVLNRYIPVHPGTSQHVLVHPVSTCACFAPGCTLLARLKAAHSASSSMRSSHSKVKRQQLYSFTVTHPPYLGAGGLRPAQGGRRRPRGRRGRRRGAAGAAGGGAPPPARRIRP